MNEKKWSWEYPLNDNEKAELEKLRLKSKSGKLTDIEFDILFDLENRLDYENEQLCSSKLMHC